MRKRLVPVALAIMLIGVGAYEWWLNTAMRDHPWLLESYAGLLLGDCRTGPGASVYRKDLDALAAQMSEAKLCLLFQDETWFVRRDFTPCVQKLLSTSLDALRIRLQESARFQDEKSRLDVLLRSLALEVDSETSALKAGTRFEVRNYSHTRAETLLQVARDLAANGQVESALTEAMSANVAWAQNRDFVETELARFSDSSYLAQWERSAQALLRWTKQTGRSAILVNKLEHRCLLLINGRIEKSYVVNLGINWYRTKVREMDLSTPEGDYRIKGKARSGRFGYSLQLDYPNAADWQRFANLKRTGEIPARARIGGNIEIHGGGRANSDWTEGCVSLENTDMAELYTRAYVGMPVTIVGTSSVGTSTSSH